MTLPARALWRDARRHPWQWILAVLGVALGVAVVVAVDIANHSASRAFGLSLEAVSGRATHQILPSGPAGLDERLFTELRLGGVRPSAPVVEGHARIRGETFTLLGLEPFSEGPFREHLAGFLDADVRGLMVGRNRLALSEGLAQRLGVLEDDTVTLTVPAGEVVLTVSAVLSNGAPGLDGVLLTDIATAQELLERVGRLDRIDLIFPRDAVPDKALADLLPEGVRVEEAGAREASARQLTRAFHINLTAMSLLALLVGGFLIYNTLMFAVLRRRPLLAALRALGVTRGGVFRLVMTEALVLALLGGIPGLLLGVLIGQGLVQMVTRTINDLYFVLAVTALHVPVWLLVKGLALGVGAALIAALGPALEAARTRPREGMRRSSRERRAGSLAPWLAAAGIVLILLGYALVGFSTRGLVIGFVALFFMIIGYSLLVPFAVRSISRLLGRPMGAVLGAPGRLAARGLGAALSRTGVAVAALTVAVSATVGVGVMVDSFRTTVQVWLGHTLQSHIYVNSAAPGDAQAGSLLPPGVVERVAALPEVAAFSTGRRFKVASDLGPVELFVLKPAPASYEGFRFRAGDPARAWSAWRAGEAVLVSEPFAWRYGVSVGDALTLHTPGGDRLFSIEGVYQDYGSQRGVVLIPRDVFREHWDVRTEGTQGVYLADGVSVEAGAAAIRAALADLPEPVLVTSAAEIRETSMTIFDRTFAITHVLRMLTVGVAFVGILSALMALQFERAREFGVLRATGMTPGQVTGLVSLQGALLGLAAGLLAIPLGLMMADVLIDVINRRSFGWSMVRTVPAPVLLEGVLLAVGAALLAGLRPAWQTGRARPADALREE
ncbi:ABC transporter permease [Thioalkalivibrio denitrificans]|uniref:ABC transporter permease n=1 Tax=Thioalkalivibrio denitrificans TaxID=108003 RepID=A0A1V3NSZ3_9GAMM|nr:ABC transporter permease [Thioalkalivibrio denitrificans]OOG28151.1 ABC transporter permease [Thioalkalivibrio denitrificans]